MAVPSVTILCRLQRFLTIEVSYLLVNHAPMEVFPSFITWTVTFCSGVTSACKSLLQLGHLASICARRFALHIIFPHTGQVMHNLFAPIKYHLPLHDRVPGRSKSLPDMKRKSSSLIPNSRISLSSNLYWKVNPQYGQRAVLYSFSNASSSGWLHLMQYLLLFMPSEPPSLWKPCSKEQDVLFQKEADEHSHSVGSGRIPSSLRFLLDILYW